MVRSGKSPTHRIIATLKSGKRLNIVQRDAASGYSKVQLSGGREGWVLTRLLNNIPSAKARLARSEAALSKLQNTYKATKTKFASLSEQKGDLDSKSSDLEKLNSSLSKELDQLKQTAANAVQTQEERDQLLQRVVGIERDYETVKRENDILKSSDSQDWFLVGAGVLLLGILLGFILPKLSWRKKSSWESSF
ncbi:MAG: hypothetical protein COB26_05920 [Piscirickettsiaceae bacterium]|nr:MAG: hypothetical protein COB89_02210 [Piscirickettsiaceae bacterium]PCI69589.1 MAG: hypothetical protein COB26_05920 [Piscirickettsiaceae bacterium]